VELTLGVKFGTHPTIIINCIAAPITSSTITSLTTPQFADTLTTNVTAHFNLLSVFLPAILSSTERSPSASTGGTIVSVSSILSHFSPAHLAAYSASKAALSSLHYTLTAEVRNMRLSHKVKTILVEPGQIDTALFAGVETPSRFFAPVLDTREVCKAITGLVDVGEGGVIRLPSYAGWVAWYGILPIAVQRVLRWVSGLDVAMKKAGMTRSDMVRETGADNAVGGGKEKKEEENTNSGDDMVVVEKL
jgi:NAD(P)-dependent dehydrogenase (short-subunit alcohol dehydrogenase family)